MQVAQTKTTYMALAGLFAALTAICSWISIPLGFTPVPMNLATLAVLLAGGLLGARYGAVSLTVYTLVGAVGVPVFAGFRGGFSVIAGPTGGYIVGYIAAAFVVGLLVSLAYTGVNKSARQTLLMVTAMVAGLAVCYALGTAWFIISTHSEFKAALVACVVPFLPGEIIKIIAGTLLVKKLKKHVDR